MTKRKVWRYKCDFCGRTSCGGGAMASHEERCFKNPKRHCPICQVQWPIEALAGPIAALATITPETEAVLIKAISDRVDGCPACICAAIQQAPLPMTHWENYDLWGGNVISEGEIRYWVSWNYAKARDAYRAEMAADERPGF